MKAYVRYYRMTSQFLFIVITLLIAIVPEGVTQSAQGGEFVYVRFLAPSLSANQGGENPVRRLTVYLPPDYDSDDKRYPVIYFLHGYGVNDSLIAQWFDIREVLDHAIDSKKIPPVIVV